MPAPSVTERYLTDSITTADPRALIVMLYDRLALDLARAEAALREPRGLEAAHNNLVHAQDVVLALRASLRPELWEGSEQLVALYEWLGRQLVEANMKKDPAAVAECISVVAPLQAAWRAAAVRGATGDDVG
ncbi:MAG TPA: flagellar export chaperone FliS [Acidimicrobiales bacterium]|nr:flagellar export chaperone FliS [Acidimicrobiales bacterium]